MLHDTLSLTSAPAAPRRGRAKVRRENFDRLNRLFHKYFPISTVLGALPQTHEKPWSKAATFPLSQGVLFFFKYRNVAVFDRLFTYAVADAKDSKQFKFQANLSEAVSKYGGS